MIKKNCSIYGFSKKKEEKDSLFFNKKITYESLFKCT